jgi:predicted Zn-dependent protease with MMP-like domain
MTRIPKPYANLPTKEKEEIKKYMTEIAVEIAKERETLYCQQCLGVNIKTSAIALYEGFGMTPSEIIQFIGNFKRIWKYNNRLLDKGITENYLDERITEIFGKNGFPKEFVDDLLSQVELYEGDD